MWPSSSSTLDSGKRKVKDISLSHQDMVLQAAKHITFLKQMHSLSMSLQQPSRVSLDRYLNFWLPLVATTATTILPDDDADDDDTKRGTTAGKLLGLIPPPDVAWLWHCHRLAPADYERHARQRFQQQLVECSSSAFEFQENKDDVRKQAMGTRTLWKNHYPKERFFLRNNPADDHRKRPSVSSTDEGTYVIVNLDHFLNEDYPLLEAAERQSGFLWQVSGFKFSDERFLLKGVKNYVRFLNLFGHLARKHQRRHSGQQQQKDHQHTGKDRPPEHPQQQHQSSVKMALIPTYQIDLMWHTHILHSIDAYNQDCIRIAGRKFHHDDSINDRAEGGVLDRSYQDTCRQWKKMYGISFAVKGGMYRGEPPEEYMNPKWAMRRHPPSSTPTVTVGPSSVLAAVIDHEAPRSSPIPIPEEWLLIEPNTTYNGENTILPEISLPGEGTAHGNKKKGGYIFGKANSILDLSESGYYHIYTRQGWLLLLARLTEKRDRVRSKHEGYLIRHCTCGAPSSLSTLHLIEYHAMEKEYRELRYLCQYAQAQLETTGPAQPLTQPLKRKWGLDAANLQFLPIATAKEPPAWETVAGAACGLLCRSYEYKKARYRGDQEKTLWFKITGCSEGYPYAGGGGMGGCGGGGGCGGC